jgi:hypothetical protein
MMEPVKKDVPMNSFDFSLEMGRHKSHDVGETHELKVIATRRTSWLIYISVTDSLLERVFSVDYLVYDCDSDGDMGSIVKVRLDTWTFSSSTDGY